MLAPPIAISTLAIVLIAGFLLVDLLLLLGYLGVRARSRRQRGSYSQHVAAADSALEQARAQDRGWDRRTMEAAARQALERSRAGWTYSDLHLVLVDDRPGSDEDRAHFVAVDSSGQEARVVLARTGDRWAAEQVD
jgi:hypothetical protein